MKRSTSKKSPNVRIFVYFKIFGTRSELKKALPRSAYRLQLYIWDLCVLKKYTPSRPCNSSVNLMPILVLFRSKEPFPVLVSNPYVHYQSVSFTFVYRAEPIHPSTTDHPHFACPSPNKVPPRLSCLSPQIRTPQKIPLQKSDIQPRPLNPFLLKAPRELLHPSGL